jgi:hypothetical protein
MGEPESNSRMDDGGSDGGDEGESFPWHELRVVGANKGSVVGHGQV